MKTIYCVFKFLIICCFLSNSLIVSQTLAEADWSLIGSESDAYFGYSVSTAGDVNNDGYDDVIIGAPLFDSFSDNEGAAFFYLGSTSGLETNYSIQLKIEETNCKFGCSVSSAGDVNGDGYDDVLVGAERYGAYDKGSVFVYYGSSSGLSLSNYTRLSMDTNPNTSLFGCSVSSAGDVNNDGYDDIIIGARQYTSNASIQINEGAAYVYLGSSGGISSTPVWNNESNSPGAYYGFSVSTAGDVNGDDYDDIVVGAYNYSTLGNPGEGVIYIYFGSSTGTTNNVWWTQLNQNSMNLGYSVSNAGDVNNDGYDDIIAGARYYTKNQTQEGAVFLFLGKSTWTTQSLPDQTMEVNLNNSNFGWSVSYAGDINMDGYDDIIAGAPFYNNNGGSEGRAFTFWGAAGGLRESIWNVGTDQSNAELGFSVSDAGDVNGDGYSDVIIGADSWTSNNGGAAFLFNSPGVRQIPVLENFEYSTGELRTVGDDWYRFSGASNDMNVTTGNLTYTDYQMSAIGNILAITNGNDDLILPVNIKNISGTETYCSFLTNLTSVSTTEQYFAALGNEINLGALLWIRQDSDGFNIGISKNSETAVSWLSTKYSLNATYLIVIGYEVVDGSSNDILKLWVNPDLDITNPASDITIVGGGVDFPIQGMLVFQNSNTPKGTIDAIRIADTWLDAPLPVELNQFTAYQENGSVVLNWSTETEINNYGFKVERSEKFEKENGIVFYESDFYDLGFVPGSGNSNIPNEYYFVDHFPPKGIINYRLKQIDLDGSFNYSETITINRGSNFKFYLSDNYPNPFNPTTKIKFNIPNPPRPSPYQGEGVREGLSVSLIVYNILGKKVATLINEIKEPGIHEVKFSGKDLPSGVYFYKLTAGEYSATKKMLLLK